VAAMERTWNSDPSHDVVLPLCDQEWLTPLLDEDAVAATMNAHRRAGTPPVKECHVRHVRYRPGASCTVLYDVFGGEVQTETSARPVTIHVRALALGRDNIPSPVPSPGAGTRPGMVLDGPLVQDAGRTVWREFPLDAVLGEIALLDEPDELARDLAACFRADGTRPTWATASFETVRYKPEVRLVLRCDLRWRHDRHGAEKVKCCQVRFERGVDPQDALTKVRLLAARLPQDGLLTVPAAAIAVPEKGYAVLEWMSGDDLARRMKRGESMAAEMAGRALAALQDMSAAGLPTRDPAEALVATQRQVAMMQNNQPTVELARLFTVIMAALTRCLGDTAHGPRGLVHGDFHQGQLLGQDGKICILDWDRVHRGDPAADYGNFLAQLELLDLRDKIVAAPLAVAFGEAHACAGGIDHVPARIRFWLVLGLVELALREIRRLRTGWDDSTTKILVRCLEILTREDAT